MVSRNLAREVGMVGRADRLTVTIHAIQFTAGIADHDSRQEDDDNARRQGKLAKQERRSAASTISVVDAHYDNSSNMNKRIHPHTTK